MSTSWFTIRAAAGSSSAEIVIFDEIGSGGITAEHFRNELKSIGSAPLTVYINSPGGSVFDGFAIYNMLKAHRAHITVRVEGVAASIASLIAMAGSEVIMPANAMMMVHDPAGLVIGTAREMADMVAMLGKVKEGMVSAYATKSRRSRSEVAAIMSAETWYTAHEAVAAGFADRVEEPVQIAATFDLSRYSHPPAAGTLDDIAAQVYGRSAPAAAPTTFEAIADAVYRKPEPADAVAQAAVEDSTADLVIHIDADAIYARYNGEGQRHRKGGAS